LVEKRAEYRRVEEAMTPYFETELRNPRKLFGGAMPGQGAQRERQPGYEG